VSAGHVPVKIYGETYPLRTAEPAARLEKLARYVDARMREVAASGKVVATSKIAVLAALYIADELFRLRETPPPAALAPPALPADLEQRLSALARTLEDALAPPGETGPTPQSRPLPFG
jgi:cell division protein ZapA